MYRLYSTSAAHGFKDYEYSLQKPPGVFRILVLGDSMAFGQGVPVDETFSKVLETMLNRKSTTFVSEVINSSAPGLNAVHEYCLQKTLGLHYQPDLYLLTLCCNDAELFQPTEIGDYEEHLRRIWDPEADTWPYFVESLARMKRNAESQGAALAVAYLVFGDPSLAPRAPKMVREICHDLNVQFTEVGESTGQYPPESLWLNRVERHPNKVGHQVIAQHPARFLAEGSLLPTENPNTEELRVLLNMLGFLTGEGLALGAQGITNPLAKMFSLLQTKLTRQRAGDQSDGRMSKEDIEQTLKALSPLLRFSQIVECLDAYDTFLRFANFRDKVPLFTTKQMLADLSLFIYHLSMMSRGQNLLPEMMTHTDENPPAPDIRSLHEAKDAVLSGVHQIGSLERHLSHLCEGPLAWIEDSDRAEGPVGLTFGRIAARLRQCVVAPHRPFMLFAAEARRIGLALEAAADELAEELHTFQQRKVDDFQDADQFRRYRHLARETTDLFARTAGHFCSCLDDINIEELAQALERLADGKAAPWPGRYAEFEISVNAPPSDDYRHVGLLWTNLVPLSAPQRDTMAIETDGKDHCCRFRFFVGVLGYFILQFTNCEVGYIRSIRMLFNGKDCREWMGEDLQALERNGMRGDLLMMAEID